MTKIKNKKELVLRAQGHARHDRVAQGTYGNGKVNGHADYRGCAIGCLSTPHRKADLRAWLMEHLSKATYAYVDAAGNKEVGIQDIHMLNVLERDFGIGWEVARVAEAIFEALPTHGAAIEFIPAFAKALPEGVEIDGELVREWWEENATDPEWREPLMADEVNTPATHDAYGLADEFLGWLSAYAEVTA
jgi:hypothetical protein